MEGLSSSNFSLDSEYDYEYDGRVKNGGFCFASRLRLLSYIDWVCPSDSSSLQPSLQSSWSSNTIILGLPSFAHIFSVFCKKAHEKAAFAISFSTLSRLAIIMRCCCRLIWIFCSRLLFPSSFSVFSSHFDRFPLHSYPLLVSIQRFLYFAHTMQ